MNSITRRKSGEDIEKTRARRQSGDLTRLNPEEKDKLLKALCEKSGIWKDKK